MSYSALAVLDYSLVVAGVLWVAFFFKRRSASPRPLPPGPKGWPIIGNVLDMPAHHQWFRFAEWGKTYGDIIHLNLLGQPMIILNSYKYATEMLDKKSLIYSDRPVLVMGGEIVGWKDILLLTHYGERFREYRRFMHRFLGGKQQVDKILAVEEHETRKFLRTVLRDPENFATHIRKTAGAIILKLLYGYEVQEGADSMVHLVEVATEQLSMACAPGAFLVDVFPILRHVPAWFPGAGWKKTASFWEQTLTDMTDVPYDYVKKQMLDDTNIPNWTSELLYHEKIDAEKEFNIKWTAASLYAGGADTTVSAIHTFFLAMTLFPCVQRRAQAELDSVVGADRLPNFDDREQLPYVEALVKEVLRWNPVTPLGGPHRLREDDIHDGYLIPKGSIVIANIWKLLHDPDVYPNPLVFNPSRFLPDTGKAVCPDPASICFGFGRRICPGLRLADVSVFISCAMILAVFDIAKVVENGKVLEPTAEYTSGVISHPQPFKCSIKPRSTKAEELILAFDEMAGI